MTTNTTTITPMITAVVDEVVVEVVSGNECVENVLLTSVVRLVEGNNVDVIMDRDMFLSGTAAIVVSNGVDIDSSNKVVSVGVIPLIGGVSAADSATTKIVDYCDQYSIIIPFNKYSVFFKCIFVPYFSEPLVPIVCEGL